jgi:hypothetical protein
MNYQIIRFYETFIRFLINYRFHFLKENYLSYSFITDFYKKAFIYIFL